MIYDFNFSIIVIIIYLFKKIFDKMTDQFVNLSENSNYGSVSPNWGQSHLRLNYLDRLVQMPLNFSNNSKHNSNIDQNSIQVIEINAFFIKKN